MHGSRPVCSMLSRKASCAGMMMSAAVAGADRSRVGERLQAALAGLQELHLLKDRHSDMVSWALRIDREEPVCSVQAGPEDPNMMGVEEQRLEATLTALKQQLVGHCSLSDSVKTKVEKCSVARTQQLDPSPCLLYSLFFSLFFSLVLFICCDVIFSSSSSSADADSVFNYYRTLS